MNNPVTGKKINTFKQLHASGCFIMPNPWDIGSAKHLENLGFRALATTSAGFAFTKGLPDSVSALTRDVVIAHFRDIAGAVSVPVNGDFQNGYASEPDDVAQNVLMCLDTGIAGISIEDATGDDYAPLYERTLAIERIKAVRAAIDSSGIPVVLTARCEAFLYGLDTPLKTVIDRLTAFADAGADCLFAPGVSNLNEIEEIVNAVAPKPVNVLVASAVKDLDLENLSNIGVRRISVGSALARTAWKGFMTAAGEILKQGTFNSFTDAASFSELNTEFKG